MASPWFQFKPVVSAINDSSPAMTFPALVEGRYSILKSKENHLAVVEADREREEGDPIGVFVEVDEGSRVTLHVASESNVSVKIDGREIEKGAFEILETGKVVQLGDHPYVFSGLPTEIPNVTHSLQELIMCQLCNRPCKDRRLLRCGHSYCGACLNEKMQAAMSSTTIVRNLRLPAGVTAAAERNEILQQIRTISCNGCLAKYSCWEVTKAYSHVAANELLPIVNSWVGPVRGIGCSDCSDTRCITDVKCYEFCEDCCKILCPVCALEKHRSHTLRSRQAMIKGWHECNNVVVSQKIKAMDLQKQETALNAEVQRNTEEFKRMMDQMKSTLTDAYEKCAKVIPSFEDELMNNLMDSNSEAFARFDAQMEESKKQMMQINAAADRLLDALDETAGPSQ